MLSSKKLIKKSKMENIIEALQTAGQQGVNIIDLTKIVYGKNTKKQQLRLIKYICMLRDRHGLRINYNKKK